MQNEELSENRLNLLVLKGTISEMEVGEQMVVKEVADAIRTLVKDAGDLGHIALVLVGLEISIAGE